MKPIMQTSSHARKPELRIVQKGPDLFKVFDKNDHFRCSFGSRAAAQAYIDQRLGITHKTAVQPQAEAA